MPYNRVNLLRHYKTIVASTEEHYEEGVTTYKGVWRKYIYPQYHISYPRYMEIIGTPNLDAKLEAEEKRHGKWKDPRQGKLF